MAAATAPRIVFYAPVSDLRLLEVLEFYSEDLRSLESLGCNVHSTNSMVEAVRMEGDVLYAWWWHSAVLAIAAWRLRGRPVIATGASHLFERSSSRRARSALRSALTIVGMRLATENIAVSQIEASKIRRVRSSHLRCIPHAVDTDFFHPDAKASSPVGIVVAQLNAASIERKGVDTAIRAVERIRKSVPEFRLVLAGSITHDGRAVLDRLRDEVDFAGIDIMGEVSREEKQRHMAEAWVSLQPSVYEGFGVSVLEAMACGTVPVCSHGGALPEVVGDGGIVLPVTSVKAVARAVEVLVGDPDRLRVLGERARARALLFDRSEHTEALSKMLYELGVVGGGV
jgi:glycosyltransferase involved in cell wall biosynthesis